MGEHLSPLAVAHLLQHTLRSLCIHEDSQWVYAVFWRILPRNYPPPKWDPQGGALDRSRGNRRNWILVWEDGFCNFAASASNCAGSSGGYGSCDSQHIKGLLPEIFFKMSHEIYSYGEGLIGKVAADHGHKWVFREPQDHEVNLPSSWHNPADSHPRTWESQFQCGIKTIALIAVREGVVQLGAVNKVAEDLSYVVLLRKKFNYLESIPGVLLPHPSSPAFPFKVDGCYTTENSAGFNVGASAPTVPMEFYSQLNQQMRITPSMSSLEALLSKLPPVGPGPPASSPPLSYLGASLHLSPPPPRPADAMGFDGTAKEEIDVEYGASERTMEVGGQSSSSMSGWYTHTTKPSEEF